MFSIKRHLGDRSGKRSRTQRKLDVAESEKLFLSEVSNVFGRKKKNKVGIKKNYGGTVPKLFPSEY